MTMATSPTSALLPQEPVLLMQGRLAAALGLAPALFLQQVHYWLLRSRHVHNGQPWIYNTYAQWQAQFPFLSRDQLARAVATLRRLEVLQVAHWDADRRERRNWYSIDYARLAAVLGTDDVSAPMVADLAENLPTSSTSELPDTACVPTCDPAMPASTPSPPPATQGDGAAISARPYPTERTPMKQIGTMDDSAASAHPEITPAEISQRLPQEKDAPPCRSGKPQRGRRNGLTEAGPGAVFLCPPLPPSAPGGAEPPDDNGPPYGTQIMSTAFPVPPAAPAVADHRASPSLPRPRLLPRSAFRPPRSSGGPTGPCWTPVRRRGCASASLRTWPGQRREAYR